MSQQWAEPSRTASRRPIVKVEEPAQSLATTNATGARRCKRRIDEFIADTLVMPGARGAVSPVPWTKNGPMS